MDWDKLKIFKGVCDAGSLTKAASKLHLTQSSLSRQISKLEEDLGVPLFHRHARGLTPTQHGDMLYQAAGEVEDILGRLRTEIDSSRSDLSGSLNISAPVQFGADWLVPRLSRFSEQHSELKLELNFLDDRVDLRQGEADVAIRIGPHDDTDLFQQHLASFRWRLYASAGHLLGYGPIDKPDDLKNQTFIHMRKVKYSSLNDGVDWLKQVLKDVDHSADADIEINDLTGLYNAVQSSLGIGALPEFMVTESSPLKVVLPELEGPELDAYLCCSRENRHSPRIQAFLAYLNKDEPDSGLDVAMDTHVACPKCSWQPLKSTIWTCTCGHKWNTFDSKGVCPGCKRNWAQTECRKCRTVSAHEAWYVIAK